MMATQIWLVSLSDYNNNGCAALHRAIMAVATTSPWWWSPAWQVGTAPRTLLQRIFGDILSEDKLNTC